jgi:putative DNA primase/helicase
MNKSTTRHYTLPEIKELAKGRWATIFEELAPELHEAMANAPRHVACPVHGGTDGFRLFEHYDDTGRGVCNTCGPQKSGIDMLMWVKGWDLKTTISHIANFLREDEVNPHPEPVFKREFRPRVDPKVAEARLRQVWSESVPIAGTPAETYLVKRGIWRENLSDCLRYHPDMVYVDNKTKKGVAKYPCLIAPVRNIEGQIVTLHRIYLTPEGDKAPVDEVKKMMSPRMQVTGSAIRLFPADSEVLGVAEGIETALAAHAISRMPVWSCVSAGLMEKVKIPNHVKQLVVWADLDKSRRGEAAAQALAKRFEGTDVAVEICLPFAKLGENDKGIDWLDVMLTQGLSGFPAKWRRWRPVVGT